MPNPTMKALIRITAVFVMSVYSFAPAHAQEVAYSLDWGAPNSHLFDVEMRFQNPEEGPVSVRIPAWRPGRYVIQNYAKNIIRFEATDGEGAVLPTSKTDKSTWSIDAPAGTDVVVRYQAYSHVLDAGSSYLDDSEAYVNPITLLMYIPGYESMATTLQIAKPDDWKVATQLNYSESRGAYVSDDYHTLVDAPILMSPTLELLSFEYGGATFEVAIQGEHDLDRQQLLADLQKIADVQVNLMGVLPFDRYVFIYHFLEHSFGHGVEHRNSTSIVLGPSSSPGFHNRVLSISAHEFFHAWNVERIRPEEIYHPDYSGEQYSTTMWIYEGITSYYTSLTLVRAGLISEESFLGRLSGSIRSYDTSPGKEVTSIAMSSFDSWTKSMDAPPNTHFSFYSAGAVMGLLLDMEVRGRTRNRQSLDNVMQYLYQEYAARDRGVPEDGLQKAIEVITNGTMQPFFDAHIYGTDPIDYDRYLFHAGYRLEISPNPDTPPVSLGIKLVAESDDVVIESVAPETPGFAAGLDMDDVLLAIDGTRLTRANLDRVLSRYKSGDSVVVTYFRRNELRSAQVTFDDTRDQVYRLVRLPQTVSLQNMTRRDWMNLAAG